MIIGVVALVVVGPERFPGMLKQIGHWVGKFRRVMNSVKTDIAKEVDKADQLQTLLDEQKNILERHVEIDLSKPAVKPRTPNQEVNSSEAVSSDQESLKPIPRQDKTS